MDEYFNNCHQSAYLGQNHLSTYELISYFVEKLIWISQNKHFDCVIAKLVLV